MTDSAAIRPSDKAMQLAGETVREWDCEDWPDFILHLARHYDALLAQVEALEQQLADAVQAEREACAKFLIDEGYDHADLVAAAIRRRGA